MLIGIFQDWATEDPDPLSAKNNLQLFLKVSSSIWDWREERNLPREGSNTGRGTEGKPASDTWLLWRKSTGELSLSGTQPRLLGGGRRVQPPSERKLGVTERPQAGEGQFPLTEGIQGKEGQPAPIWCLWSSGAGERLVRVPFLLWDPVTGSPCGACVPQAEGEYQLNHIPKEQDTSIKSSILCACWTTIIPWETEAQKPPLLGPKTHSKLGTHGSRNQVKGNHQC